MKNRFLSTLFMGIVAVSLFQPITAKAARIALVIGNSQYTDVDPLPNPKNDAKAIAQALRDVGFKVIEKTDLSRRAMTAALREFRDSLDSDSQALFYYAGHGIQREGHNYLLPVDTKITNDFEIEHEGVDMKRVMDAMQDGKARLRIVMLDACRNNPFEARIRGITRGNFVGNGLAALEAVRGTILSYATQPGNVAEDGRGKHSPYTKALLAHLDTPGMIVQSFFNEVGLDVLEATNDKQEPWVSSSPIKPFCFAGCEPTRLTAKDRPAAQKRIEQFAKAFESHNLKQLNELAIFDSSQIKHIQSVFRTYPTLKIAVSDIELQEQTNNVLAKVTIKEATNQYANRVYPAPSWGQMQVNLQKRGTTWRKITLQ